MQVNGACLLQPPLTYHHGFALCGKIGKNFSACDMFGAVDPSECFKRVFPRAFVGSLVHRNVGRVGEWRKIPGRSPLVQGAGHVIVLMKSQGKVPATLVCMYEITEHGIHEAAIYF